MAKRFKKANQCLLQRRRNGYSIAEILLVFGIIAGVLIGLRGDVHHARDETDAQSAIAEIHMLVQAAYEYKYAPGEQQNTYTGANMAKLKPYLGLSGIANGQNIFGSAVTVTPLTLVLGNYRNLKVAYPGVRDLDICRQILNRFGQVKDIAEVRNASDMVTQAADTYIEGGTAISGYVGRDDSSVTGCEAGGGTYTLNVTID